MRTVLSLYGAVELDFIQRPVSLDRQMSCAVTKKIYKKVFTIYHAVITDIPRFSLYGVAQRRRRQQGPQEVKVDEERTKVKGKFYY